MANLPIILTALTLATLLMLPVVLQAAPAFALQPYEAGYPNTTTVTKHLQYTAKSDFSDTTLTTPRSGKLISVFSSATFASTSATSPTGWVHQQAVVLNAADNNIRGIFQVYNSSGGCAENCPGDVGTFLGEHGTSSSKVNFVYTTMIMGSTIVTYYYESWSIGGNVLQTPIRTYTKANDNDPSNYFAVGTLTKLLNGPNQTYKMKYYQFGVESDSTVTQTWKVTQYDLTYQGATSLGNLPAKVAQFSGNTNGSCITIVTVGGLEYCSAVGQQNYSNAQAKANSQDGTVPKGKVIWFKGTMTPGGTTLWT